MTTPRPHGEAPDMTDYGVGGDGWNALPWAWAGERLRATRNYWVITADAAGQPHAMPVWGVWDDDELRFAFSCSPKAKKVRNVLANPRVCFTNGDTVECVSVQGTARLLDHERDADRIHTWGQRWGAKYRDEIGEDVGDDFEEFLRSNASIEVVPTVAFAMIERADDFATRATRWRFA